MLARTFRKSIDTVLLVWLGMICSMLIAAPVDCLFQLVEAEEIEPLEEADGPEEELLESAVDSGNQRKRIALRSAPRGRPAAPPQHSVRLASANRFRQPTRPSGGLTGRNGCDAILRC